MTSGRPADITPTRHEATEQTAARCAYGVGIGRIVDGLMLIGFFLAEFTRPRDETPLGTASGLSSIATALLIPPALTLATFLPDRRSTVAEHAGVDPVPRPRPRAHRVSSGTARQWPPSGRQPEGGPERQGRTP
jgi:hypothetical protein